MPIEHDVRVSLRAGDDVGAVGDRAPGAGAVEHRQILPREDEHAGTDEGHRHPPGVRGLIGVRRPDGDQLRDGAQADQLLDRLVRRAILADGDAVVGEDEDHLEV